MSRDYKNRVSRGKKKTGLSPLVGILGGLLIGLFIAFLVYLKMQPKPPEQVYERETLQPAVETSQQDTRAVRKDEKDVIPSPPKPRFDFYTLLPEMEVVIPEEEITESRKQPPPPPVVKPVETKPVAATKTTPEVSSKPAPAPVAKPAPAAKTGSYFLQVGSFRNGEQAEKFRAELAMMGMQTSIQQVTINNKDTYHRVRVGPFSSLNELDKVRQTLKKKGIDSTPIKVRG